MSIRADTRLAEERILNYVVLTVASTIEAQSIRKEICATEQQVLNVEPKAATRRLPREVEDGTGMGSTSKQRGCRRCFSTASDDPIHVSCEAKHEDHWSSDNEGSISV